VIIAFIRWKDMKNFIKILMLAFSVLALAGCYAPENFNIQLIFDEDGSYTFHYKGNLAYVPLIMDMKKENMSAEQEKKLAAEHLTVMKKNTDVKSAEYVGKGRYKVEVEEKLKPGQKLDFMSMIFVVYSRDGNITVSTAKTKEKDIEDLKSLGLNVTGELSVSVPKNAKVLSNDADSTPTLGFGSYKWNIKSLSDNANMVLTINK
jgi:hypothetical protein